MIAGSPPAGLREVIDELLAFDETFRLLCYSTPETIYRDVAHPDARHNPLARTPESAALSQIARHDLLHPEAATHIDTHMQSRKWREH